MKRLSTLPPLLLLLLLSGRGEAESSLEFELVVGLPPEQPREVQRQKLEHLFWEIATPDSPEYLRHRSLQELLPLTQASEEVVDTTRRWLLQLGAIEAPKLSLLRDTMSARFVHKPGQLLQGLAWTAKGLPQKSSHPHDFDFVMRKDLKSTQSPKDVQSGASSADRLQGHRQALKQPPKREPYTVENMKKAIGVPIDLQASNETTLQMVWGPGTFGYSLSQLQAFKDNECPLLNLSKVHFDTDNHGVPGGDNYGEGNLDTQMISSFGLNVQVCLYE